MESFTLSEFRKSTKDASAALGRDGKIVLTSNGQPMAIMVGVDSSTFEDTLLRLKRVELSRIVDKMQQMSTKNGTDTISMSEIDAEIAATRKNI